MQKHTKAFIAFLVLFVQQVRSDSLPFNPNLLSLCPTERKESIGQCWGNQQFPNGDSYVGEYENGMFSGKGKYIFQDGKIYIGDFRRNHFHGIGQLSDVNGEVYKGEFKNGLRHGKGILGIPGKSQIEGTWHNGQIEKNIIKNTANGLMSSQREDALNQAPIQQNQNKAGRSNNLNLIVINSEPNSEGMVLITVKANADIASLKINGEEQGGKADGIYKIKKIARIGQDTKFNIVAVDINGNSGTQTITVTRNFIPSSEASVVLKPENIKQVPTTDAVTIIIGIQNYKRVPNAEFANNDAREFFEYAVRALGIKPEKIKMLVDDEADEVNIVKAFENWLPIQVNKHKTDIYVFFSGHGLPAPDGKALYFLPHGVDKELLSRTAVSQNDIVAALSAAKPRSVTMFIDACYSGQTRAGDMLVANAKPVSLKSDANAYPPNFTVITASANDQISSSSPELEHGIFSFYLMKGMEGDADSNKDGKITAGEMHDYLSDKVSRQAMTLNRKQNPQLFGEPDRILLRR
jgi:hypothetical protein